MINHSTCPYCRLFIKDKLYISIKKKRSVFNSSAKIYLPDDYKDNIIIKYRYKNKRIIINKVSLKSFMMPNKNKMELKYFINYPDIIETLYIKFSNNDSEYLVELFMKIFKNNVGISHPQPPQPPQQTISSLEQPNTQPAMYTIPNYTQPNSPPQSYHIIIDENPPPLTNNYTLHNSPINTIV